MRRLRMDRYGGALLACTLLGVGCREERVAVVPTAIRAGPASDSAKVADVALGAAVRTKRVGGDPVGVLRAADGFVDERDVARMPLVVERRFVAEFGAALWADPARKERKRELKVGEPLSVLAADPLVDVDVVAVGGRPVAFVSADALGSAAPTRASLWARVEARLHAQDREGTVRALEALLVVAPQDEPGRVMLSVLLAGTDWKRSRALVAGLVPPPPYVDAGLTRADAPGPAYVLASVLRMRAAPDEQAAKVRELPIGTAVVIEELRPDGWARIHVRDDRARAGVVARGGAAGALGGLGELVEAPTDVAAGFANGYALARYLTPTAPTLDVIEARRKDAEGRGMFDEATLWAQRANELLPSHERRAALIDAALQAMRWPVAAGALVPTGVDRPSGVADIDLAFAWGCRGDPRLAKWVERDDATTSAACTTVAETRPCELCWWVDDDGVEPTPAQRAAAEEARLAAEREVRTAQAKFDERLAATRARFPDGPFLRVRSRPSSWPRAGDAREAPFVAVVRFDASVVAPGGDTLLQVLPLPLPEDAAALDGVLDLWVPVPGDESLRFDVVFAADEAQARARVPLGDGGDVPARPHVAASLARVADGCDCGC